MTPACRPVGLSGQVCYSQAVDDAAFHPVGLGLVELGFIEFQDMPCL